MTIAIACGGKKKDDGGGGTASGTGAGTGSAPVATPAFDGVEIFVGDTSVAKIATKDVANFPRLDTLVPEESRRLGTWDALSFGATKLDKPSLNHPNKLPVVFPGKDGKPAFGMFDPVEHAKKGEPAYRADNITEIRITVSKMERGGSHQGSTGDGGDPTKLVLKIGDKQLTGAEILKLPTSEQPDNADTKGWRVTQFLEAVGITKYESITLIDANGTTVPLKKAELDPAVANPFVKLNKQGALRFRMYTKKGEGWEQGADLRSLQSIKVN